MLLPGRRTVVKGSSNGCSGKEMRAGAAASGPQTRNGDVSKCRQKACKSKPFTDSISNNVYERKEKLGLLLITAMY